MDGLKKIMYGVTDFPLMRRENDYFVDRTALIELKYFKAKDKLSKQKLAAFKKQAATQLAQYAADRDLARQWHLVTASKSNNPTIQQFPFGPPHPPRDRLPRHGTRALRGDMTASRFLRRAVSGG